LRLNAPLSSKNAFDVHRDLIIPHEIMTFDVKLTGYSQYPTLLSLLYDCAEKYRIS